MGGVCGVISRSGSDVIGIVVECLRRMAFRGSDTAGIAFLRDHIIEVRKGVGDINKVYRDRALSSCRSDVAIGHTRFSTHGRPHVDNAHPHADCSCLIAVVGDGAIANYEMLRDELFVKGHRVVSRCDFEVIAHLLEDELKEGISVEEAVAAVARKLEGFFSFVVLHAESRSILAYTSLQELYVGLSRDLIAIASTRSSLHGFTDVVTELRGGELAVLSRDGVRFMDVKEMRPLEKEFKPLEVKAEYIYTDGFPHHMLREIYEIPYALLRTLSSIQEKYLTFASRLLQEAESIYIIADGTSLHAGLVGSYYLSELAKISPIVVSAAEFPLYYVENVGPGTVVIAISQSGETSDVIKSVYEAKLRGATILGITNYIGSKLANLSNLYLPIAAGPELAVPATKTFTSTLAVLYIVALRVAKERRELSASEFRNRVEELKKYALELTKHMKNIDAVASEAAKKIVKCRSGYVISRGITYPIALEGALKLKEVAYIHAEGIEAGEFKHGPIVLIGENFFTIFIVPVEKVAAEATYPLMKVAKERGATVISVGFEHDENLRMVGVPTLLVPPTTRHIAPIAFAIPLQFLSYRLGELLGRPIDSPRYLVKKVTH
ncbi:MAG: glutamine--fructose-6-phosphate transaminase (isomerizing) [Thermoprotei archaeon]|nr:MAG: glutamine--fructose-6-phosphate transaminase (isomerizing) [Thermoprotei archaeon]